MVTYCEKLDKQQSNTIPTPNIESTCTSTSIGPYVTAYTL